MSLTRRGFLGTLAALVAAPRIALEAWTEERRLYPIGTEVANLVQLDVPRDTRRISYDEMKLAKEKLAEWFADRHIRALESSLHEFTWDYGNRRGISMRGIQE